MRAVSPRTKSGFSLLDALIGTFVMGLVIAGTLTGLGQATLLSEKTSKQSTAGFILNKETERLRGMDWSSVRQWVAKVAAHRQANGTDYPEFGAASQDELDAAGMSAAARAEFLHRSGETGKAIARLTLNWTDDTGAAHAESRSLVLTEGGLSADE